MPKRAPRIKLYEWRVVSIKSTPATVIGYYQAADAEEAIKQAIVEREISDPQQQAGLAAQRVKEIG
jgi:hypothetical protein